MADEQVTQPDPTVETAAPEAVQEPLALEPEVVEAAPEAEAEQVAEPSALDRWFESFDADLQALPKEDRAAALQAFWDRLPEEERQALPEVRERVAREEEVSADREAQERNQRVVGEAQQLDQRSRQAVARTLTTLQQVRQSLGDDAEQFDIEAIARDMDEYAATQASLMHQTWRTETASGIVTEINRFGGPLSTQQATKLINAAQQEKGDEPVTQYEVTQAYMREFERRVRADERTALEEEFGEGKRKLSAQELAAAKAQALRELNVEPDVQRRGPAAPARDEREIMMDMDTPIEQLSEIRKRQQAAG